ncbi:hypothetical protein WMY93_021094 [Mugilogobius chulae]|uniref:YqaJ viral recombinase domain-containing protein n=1 Tax=Mugilogobius chulae TaxID=88201 RepID=A0AAW0NE99_9GOBI
MQTTLFLHGCWTVLLLFVLELTDEDILELRLISPDAAVLTSIENSDTDTASECELEDLAAHPELPDPLTALYDPTLKQQIPPDIRDRCQEAFHKIKRSIHTGQCERLTAITKEQSASPSWHIHRAGRITSTTFYNTSKSGHVDRTTLHKIMGYTDNNIQVPAVVWGRENEKIGRQHYINYISKRHNNVTVDITGFVVRPDEPHLGTSPDGTVSCSCCGDGVLEIKCPYRYREGLRGAHLSEDFCLDQRMQLKKKHQYYHQVQLHMFVSNVNYCDFIVWTTKELIINRIQRDEQLLQEALVVAKESFLSCILPELITRSQDPALRQQRFCSLCEKPEFGKMIDCTMCEKV